MSKSILVIDTPKNCTKCPLFFGAYTDMVCRGNGYTINYPVPENRIQDWCPLKEIPKKKEPRKIRGDNLWGYHISAFDKGYNKCIDEILKETN